MEKLDLNYTGTSAQSFDPMALAKMKADTINGTPGDLTGYDCGKCLNPVVLSGFMDIWADHVNEMSMYHSFVLPMEDFRRVYNYQSQALEGQAPVSVNSTIQNAYGKAAVEYIDQLYRDLNGGAISDPRETPAKEMMGKFKKASVLASLSVTIQQPSAIGRAFAIIDPTYFIGPRMDGKRHDALWEEVKKYAPVAVIKEMGYFDTGMGKSAHDFLTGKEYYTLKEKAVAVIADEDYRDELLGRLPALMDELAWCTIWEAAKRETKAKHPDTKVGSEEFLRKAGERFTEVIIKTQVYDSVLSKSANMRSKSTMMSMATAFMAEPTTTINMVEDALRKAARGEKKHAARVLGSVLVSVVLNSLLASLVYAARDDDEDETFWEKYTQSVAVEILDGLNPLTYYPWIKDVWSILQGYDVERSDMSLISSLAEASTKLIQVYIKDTEDMDEKELAEHGQNICEAWWGMVDYVTALANIPVKNVRRDINGAFNFVNTVAADLTDRDTTWASWIDKTWDSVKNSIPVVGWMPDETAADKLYKATVNGDTGYQKRLESAYNSTNALNSAISRGLRANDSRIREAAIAWNSNDLDEYMRVAKEIIAEGNFSQDNVVAAIRAEASSLMPSETASEPKAKSLFTAEKFVEAVAQGDSNTAAAARVDLIETAQRNGKTPEEAEDSFNSSAKTKLKEVYLNGKLTDTGAVEALTNYCGMTQDEADDTVAEWGFEVEYGFTYASRAQQFKDGVISAAELKDMLMDTGGETEKEASSSMVGYCLDGYEEDYFSRSEATQMMVAYCGLTASEAEAKLRCTDFKIDNPQYSDLSDSAIDRYLDYCVPSGIDVSVFYNARHFCSSIESDGTYGNVKRQYVDYILSLNLSSAQQNAMWYALKNSSWSEKDTPFH